MDTLPHVITTPKLTTTFRHGLTTSTLRYSNRRFRSFRAAKNVRVFSELKSQNNTTRIDYTDPGWTTKFKEDFEARFRLPHVTDTFPESVSMPSTFCLKMRTPLTSGVPGNYQSDEEWNGYINDNDRVLLKTIYHSSPTSAGAECIDPGCNWVEQW